MNHVISIAAVVQIRDDTRGREYHRRKLAAGKTPLEALRYLKRRISDAIHRQLIVDAQRDLEQPAEGSRPGFPEASGPTAVAGPKGHSGATRESSATT
jgi:transposase